MDCDHRILKNFEIFLMGIYVLYNHELLKDKAK